MLLHAPLKLHRFPAKFPPWPKTVLAAVSAAVGWSYSRTRLLSGSVTYRRPKGSSARPDGLDMLLALIPPLLFTREVKLPCCPSTRSASRPEFLPLLNGAL